MSDFLIRATKQFLISVNDSDPEVAPALAIVEPTVGGFRMRHWIGAGPRQEPRYVNIVGDTVTEMTAAEKDAVDAVEAQAALEAERALNKQALLDAMDRRALIACIVDELNALRGVVTPPLPQRTYAQFQAALDAKINTMASRGGGGRP
jgi:hypothetical protein